MGDDQSEISRLQRADTLGLEFVRTTMLLNGGAVILFLTFVGNTKKDAMISFEISSVTCAMLAFLIGICSMLFALILSYSYAASHSGNRSHQLCDNWMISFNSLCGLLSIFAFSGGVVSLILGDG